MLLLSVAQDISHSALIKQPVDARVEVHNEWLYEFRPRYDEYTANLLNDWIFKNCSEVNIKIC